METYFFFSFCISITPDTTLIATKRFPILITSRCNRVYIALLLGNKVWGYEGETSVLTFLTIFSSVFMTTDDM